MGDVLTSSVVVERPTSTAEHLQLLGMDVNGDGFGDFLVRKESGGVHSDAAAWTILAIDCVPIALLPFVEDGEGLLAVLIPTDKIGDVRLVSVGGPAAPVPW